MLAATEEQPTAWRGAAAVVLQHYTLDVVELERIAQGLVNLTVKLRTRDGKYYVLQRLHPVFSAAVNHNIALVTAHLAQRQVLTSVLIPTTDGALAVEHTGSLWRVMSFIDGLAFDRLHEPRQAQAAGELLAHFHAALADFVGELVTERPPVHDFPRHLARLTQTLGTHAGHRLQRAASAAAAVLDSLRSAALAPAPARLVHGDPKVSNILFDARGHTALCLIDLDTLARMPLAYELGDALRSWCNPQAEDAADAAFELTLFEAAMSGYAAAAVFVSADEVAAIVPATLQIHLELAARFLTDALEESYFGWDNARYATRGEHNLARARGQLAAAASLKRQWSAACEVVTRSFGWL